ncbi:hypothetical protein MFUL124B02_27240 [Myxococcus fulvus 124B02]|nr:hypothetical protein MFUL124B02_27240 [Myxococcus fulvus 124B02]
MVFNLRESPGGLLLLAKQLLHHHLRERGLDLWILVQPHPPRFLRQQLETDEVVQESNFLSDVAYRARMNAGCSLRFASTSSSITGWPFTSATTGPFLPLAASEPELLSPEHPRRTSEARREGRHVHDRDSEG